MDGSDAARGVFHLQKRACFHAMTGVSTAATVIATILALGGAAALVWATARAMRPRAPAESFAWIVLAGIVYSVLGLAAAVRSPESDGLRASVLQLVAVLLAAAVGGLVPARRAEDTGEVSGLAAAAVFLAWLSLIGLPPTVGFHAKVLVYRALLAADWGWLLVIAMAAGAAALAPGFLTLATYRPGAVGGLRAVVIALLLLAIVMLGLYPQAGLAAAARVANLASGA